MVIKLYLYKFKSIFKKTDLIVINDIFILKMNTINYKLHNYPISHVHINETEDILTIHLHGSHFKYQFVAEGDCCSHSIFKQYKEFDFSQLNGKVIKKVVNIPVPDDYECEPESSDLCDSPHLYEITFKNSDEIFQFLMINYSNGYYDGWMTSSIVL